MVHARYPFTALTLPNGTLIPNRIAKAAMEENMADASQGPSDELVRLYSAWAEGEAAADWQCHDRPQSHD